MNPQTLLTGEQLVVRTPTGIRLTNPFDFELKEGEVLVVKGQNGTGKSTLLRGLLGKPKVLEGRFRFQVPMGMIGYLPQQQNSTFHLPMTLRDMLKLSLAKWELDDETRDLLAPHQWDLAWNTASGGEKKRALVVRALIRHPQVLILDEPYNHLDRESCVKITMALRRFMENDPRRSIMVVSHDDQYLQLLAGLRIKELSLDAFREER